MKIALVAIGAWLCLAVSSQAAVFRGEIFTIIEDVAEWIDWATPGEESVERYIYVSDSINGTFTPATGLTVWTPWPNSRTWTNDWPNSPVLVVVDGKVSRLNGSGTDGFSRISYRQGFIGDWNFDGVISGSFTVSDPVRISPVPDSGAALPLFALSLLGLTLRPRSRR